MVFSGKRLLIAYFSPAGSTAHVARVIQNEIEARGNKVSLFNLTNRDGISGIMSEMENGNRELGLSIGSPVYANRALPPVLDFILKLPPGINGFAVPFATWGGVCSGGALYEMSKALIFLCCGSAFECGQKRLRNRVKPGCGYKLSLSMSDVDF